MSKKSIIIVVVIGIVVAIVGGILGYNFAAKADKADKDNVTTTSNLSVNSADDLTALVDKIYSGVSIEMPMLMTMPVDIADVDAVKSFTGLDSAENIEYIVASEPMMSSQAYSLVLVKAKDGVDVDAMAKAMNENINENGYVLQLKKSIQQQVEM